MREIHESLLSTSTFLKEIIKDSMREMLEEDAENINNALATKESNENKSQDLPARKRSNQDQAPPTKRPKIVLEL